MAGIGEAIATIAPSAINLLSTVATGIFEAIKGSKQPLDIGQSITESVLTGLEAGVPLMQPILTGDIPSMMMTENDLSNMHQFIPPLSPTKAGTLRDSSGIASHASGVPQIMKKPAKPKPVPKAVIDQVRSSAPGVQSTASGTRSPISGVTKPAKSKLASIGGIAGLRAPAASKQILSELSKYGTLNVSPALAAKVKGIVGKLTSGGKLSKADDKVLKRLRLIHERQT